MEKFLAKQYDAMLKREEKNLAEYNLGKIKSEQLTLDQVIHQGYAYKDEK